MIEIIVLFFQLLEKRENKKLKSIKQIRSIYVCRWNWSMNINYEAFVLHLRTFTLPFLTAAWKIANHLINGCQQLFLFSFAISFLAVQEREWIYGKSYETPTKNNSINRRMKKTATVSNWAFTCRWNSNRKRTNQVHIRLMRSMYGLANACCIFK